MGQRDVKAHVTAHGLSLRDLDARRSSALQRRNTGAGQVYVYRGCAVNVAGEVAVDGALDLGLLWPGYAPFPSLLKVDEGARLEVSGPFAFFTGARVDVCRGGTLKLGSGYFNHNASVACFGRIEIGDGVAISDGVTLRDSDNHVLTYADGTRSRPDPQPIVIEDGVWIGLNATVLKGVRIGAGAVIGAGALVNRDVPAKCLAAGVPARVIRRDVTWAHPSAQGGT
jgi:acetyltransferase-like isoleucine patch superfamily enzyme